MLRKFLAAVILAVFLLSAQLAAAEDYDWSKAPRIGSKAELARYVESERRKGHTDFHVVLTYVNINNERELYRFIEELCNGITLSLSIRASAEYGTGRVAFVITKEYPGTNVANAYRAHVNYDDRDFNNLKPEEKQLFYEAVKIVNEASKCSSELEKARYIHDAICNRVKEFKNENDRNKTAVGALIDSYANCNGFTDAFYMLGKMAGLNVGRIGGIENNRAHAWNCITFSNGKSYCVDVTNGFNTKGTYLFCATKERMEKTHSCEWSIIPNLQ